MKTIKSSIKIIFLGLFVFSMMFSYQNCAKKLRSGNSNNGASVDSLNNSPTNPGPGTNNPANPSEGDTSSHCDARCFEVIFN